MEKGFLDLLYIHRMDVIKTIHELHEQVRYPQQKCCDNMSNYNPISEQLKMKEIELSMLDSLITAYISIHQNK
jgi:hypothetical protein